MALFEAGIYVGTRGKIFKDYIYNLLDTHADLNERTLDYVTNDENMKIISSAFTALSADSVNNLEVLEQLGDLTANKFIVWYMYKRFPFLKCHEGIKVVARLRINYGSKQSFYKIAEDLGFFPLISASTDDITRRKKKLLEDVFEAFLGAIELILDNDSVVGVGYHCVYNILSKIFDKMFISLKYEDLYDSKTRLKE